MTPDPKVGMIWAQASNGIIGRNGTMPWHLPEDFEHFRRTTEGHPVIMGRRTWDSLPAKSRPLPGRTNIVITSNPDWAADGAIRAGSLQEALEVASGQPGSDEAWIIGGGQIYREALGEAGTAALTVVEGDIEGDTYAPKLYGWLLQEATDWLTSRNGTRYRFETWTAA